MLAFSVSTPDDIRALMSALERGEFDGSHEEENLCAWLGLESEWNFPRLEMFCAEVYPGASIEHPIVAQLLVWCDQGLLEYFGQSAEAPIRAIVLEDKESSLAYSS